MKFFSNLKQKAVAFLEPYKTKGPASYAAAKQAIGAMLIADGLFGIESPFGKNKRPGIFGTLGGMFFGIMFMCIPMFFGNISGISDMTAVTTATVVSVNGTEDSSKNSCGLTVNYLVDNKEYTKKSSYTSSSHCALSEGQEVTINYNPENPASWAYGTKTMHGVLQIFFWAGLLILISSIITFVIRVLSIVFGWKLLTDGRKNAANLPAETNMQVMVDEIKKNFVTSIFGFGGSQGGAMLKDSEKVS